MHEGPVPFDAGRLDVGDGHRLYYEQVGVPDGVPVVFLHGGPGSGASPGARRSFDGARHRAVLYDQRAAGRSEPHASTEAVDWASIDMDHHMADLEQLRGHLGIERWAVFGISWGSVLGMTYAERHPEVVTAVIVAAVSSGSARDHDWLTVDAGRFYPAAWETFRDHVPEHLRGLRLVDAYNTLLMDDDPAVREAAAAAWCRWEEAHVDTSGPEWSNARYEDPAFRLGFARQVTHCWRNDSWLAPNEILDNVSRLVGIPGTLITGRLDLSGPPDNAWHFHRAWPGSVLHVVEDEGHGGNRMRDLWRQALSDLA